MNRRLHLLFISFILISGNSLRSQNMPPGEILLGLEKLDRLGSVLYIAAHPDDENTRVLSWLSKDQKLRTAYLSLTRGEGGQNLIGGEKGDMLGLIRTAELMGARRIDGAEQFFTRAVDFGYSKNPEETLQKWNRDSVLADVVRVIRYFKPDVVICRFPPTGEGGHGHHTASAILAIEAFDAAADPSRFPEQVGTLGIWQVKKLFWNTFQFGNINTTSANQLRLNVGVPVPLLGKSTGEIASSSRSMHKSQGFGTAGIPGEIIEYFKPLKGDTASKGLFTGIDFTWNRLNGTKEIQKLIVECSQKFDPSAPEKSANLLGQIISALQNMKVENPVAAMWKRVKLSEAQQLLLAVCGMRIEAISGEPIFVPGKEQALNIRAINRSAVKVIIEKLKYPDKDTLASLELPYNQQKEISHPFRLDPQAPLSTPYWLEKPAIHNLYVINEKHDLLDHGASKKLSCEISLKVAGASFNIKIPLQYRWTDPIKGEQVQDVEVLPPATVSFSEPLYILTRNDTAHISITVEANVASYKSRLRINIPENSSVYPQFVEVEIPQAKQKVTYHFNIYNPTPAYTQFLTAELQTEEGRWEDAKSIQRAAYDHIPALHILRKAEAKLLKFEGNPGTQHIGYIPGSGDDIPAILEQLGYQVSVLPVESLGIADLSPFFAIVTGVRAYNISDEPGLQHAKLMQYVQNGGNLLVQYNTNNRIGPLKSKIGPYPFEISRNRVTDENAQVDFLLPSHPVMQFPHQISQADFDGWVQERGIYFAEQSAPEYAKPFAMHDPGEPKLDGSLIIAGYGKGHFVYTGLSFFRQLPAGIPGAIRLFINLMHLPAEK